MMTRGTERVHLVGCGRMGAALLSGWLQSGLPPRNITVTDPVPSDWLKSLESIGVHVNPEARDRVDVVVIAVDMPNVATAITSFPRTYAGPQDTLYISIAGGLTMEALDHALGRSDAAIIRAMPNLAGTIRAGVTALTINAHVDRQHLQLADRLMGAFGETVLLANEDQMHAVAAISGCGPAYVCAFSEALALAAENLGLPKSIAARIAASAVSGVGQVLTQSDQTPAQIVQDLQQKCPLTAAGLNRLQAAQNGLDHLIEETTRAAYETGLKTALTKV